MKKVINRIAGTISQAMIGLMCLFANQTLTITSDNGKETAEHTAFADALVRQYFPKCINFSSLKDGDIDKVGLNLIHGARECLLFSTPWMVFIREMKAAPRT